MTTEEALTALYAAARLSLMSANNHDTIKAAQELLRRRLAENGDIQSAGGPDRMGQVAADNNTPPREP